MNIQFVNGWVLLFAWAALGMAFLWLVLFKRRLTAIRAFLDEPMLSKLSPQARPARFYWQLVLFQAGLILLIIAAARPQWGAEERKVFQRGRDLVIALDVSRSMLARDVHPSRLQRAKADVQDLLRELRGDRVALVAFRKHAVQLCPLTTDYAYLEQMLDAVTVDSAPPGETSIGAAIEKALAAFENDAGAHRAMVIISDGEDLAGQAMAAAGRAREKGAVIFTVGLGDPKGANIPGLAKSEPVMTYQGQEVISRLQHETLKNIADTTGGAYVPVGVANVKLGKLYREHLSKIAAHDIEENLQRRMIERYQLFLFPGILALLAAVFLSRGRLATRRPAPDFAGRPLKTDIGRGPGASLAIAMALLGASACAGLASNTNSLPVPAASSPVSNAAPAAKTDANLQAKYLPGREGASRAQGLYRRGAYRQAAAAYLHAMSNSSQQLQDNCRYNAGCAYYRAGDFERAADAFNRLAESESAGQALQARSYYNLGCATFRMAEQAENATTNKSPELKPLLLEKAGTAFQHALRAKPGGKRGAAAGERAAENLAAITNMRPKARQEAKIKALMDKYGQQPPSRLADTALASQRLILKDLPGVLTNATPGRIAMFEALAARQQANGDLLLPLKTAVIGQLSAQGQAQALQQHAVQLGQHIEATQTSMSEAAALLRDIDNRAMPRASEAGQGIYNIWKGLASFEQLLREDILRQTNTIAMTTSMLAGAESNVEEIKSEQTEALQLTGLFIEKFSQAVPPEGTPFSGKLPGAPSAPLPDEEAGPPATNGVPQISRETRTNILNLAGQAVQAQTAAGRSAAAGSLSASLTDQRRSHDLLKEIENLLPKDEKKQDDSQNQDQSRDKQQEQDQKDNSQDKQPPPQENTPPPPKEEQKPEQPREEPAQPEKKDRKEMSPDQLRALLDKARQREKEHREEQQRNEYTPPSPVDRDW